MDIMFQTNVLGMIHLVRPPVFPSFHHPLDHSVRRCSLSLASPFLFVFVLVRSDMEEAYPWVSLYVCVGCDGWDDLWGFGMTRGGGVIDSIGRPT
jgi:hypothetical protein